MGGTDDHDKEASAPPPPPPPIQERYPDEDSDDQDEDDHYDDDDGYSFGGGFGGHGGPLHGLSSTIRTLSGMVSGLPARFRDILHNLRQKHDPDSQLVALQELSELLLVSNEDSLSGNFSIDAFVKELVTLMQPNELTGEENPEIMLWACRCLANLMEALPASTSNIVYGQAVPILCQKLLEISFIDLAEQALSTLEKISVDYPGCIVREGGMTACLQYLDFFATSTQRVAVTTAANCCRNLDPENFPVVRDVMPILLNVLGSNDQKVVEQASLCVTRIVESFRYYPHRLEELVSVDLLKAILRLLLPGSTNLIGPHIHTQFLRVLAFVARASPRLSAELFKLNVVETLYQILTGVSPPSGDDDIASKLDSVLIMQALIHRPREQIIETLNVICELLPNLPGSADPAAGDFVEISESVLTPSTSGSRRKTANEKRAELLRTCKDEVRRFAMILFPTLTDAYSSTVNLTVRQKVLTAQLKMLSNLDKPILLDALKPVSYASFLASILSQQDHPSLVMYALQATELLVSRLDLVYRYQLYREGVIAEITKLAAEARDQSLSPESSLDRAADNQSDRDSENEDEENEEGDEEEEDRSGRSSDEEDDEDEDEERDRDDQEEDERHRDDYTGSPTSSQGSTMSMGASSGIRFGLDKARIAQVAKRFLELHENEEAAKGMREKAEQILAGLSALASDIENFYLCRTLSSSSQPLDRGIKLFTKLASYFDSDILESVTSAELLASGIVRVLEKVLSNPDEELAIAAQSAFLQVFMGYTVKSKPKTATADSPATPLSVLIHKLQDLLSRSEHFEVITVHHSGSDRSAASMLAKQIRLRLAADDDSDIPRNYRNIMVSIHAITTFKSLDDYLRPRISATPRNSRREALSRAFDALANTAGMPLNSSAAARLRQAMGGSSSSSSSSSSAAPPPPTTSGSQPSASSPLRSTRKTTRSSRMQQPGEAPSTPEPSTSREKAVLRRSSRRQGTTSSEDPAARPPPPDDEDDLDNALECADEKQLSDDEDMGDDEALDVVDEGMSEAQTPDPPAANMEMGTGGKVTARRDDGTKVSTPSHSRSGATAPSRLSGLAAALQSTPTPSSSSRPMSYAGAVQSTPNDWHLEFSINGKVIPLDMTIYRAVHNYAAIQDDYTGRGVWAAIHPVKFRRVPGPPPTTESSGFGSQNDATCEVDENGVPLSLANFPVTASILRLLKKLHDLNANLDDVLVENKETLRLNVEPLSQFVNTKLTAKLNRQLEEPLIVASQCLPSWSEDLARLYPFLFPFETRHLFLQSTSFGYARSMSRWQNAQSQEDSRRDRRADERPFLGRLQRQKVRISRNKILESAVKVMELYGASQSILEVEYFDEVGTGLGPTLEFYSTVSKEFCKKKLKMWRDNDPNGDDEYVSGSNGLFPRPISDDFAASEEGQKVLQLFKTLGKFVARSMIDSRIIDINFNPIFFRIGDESTAVRPSLGAIKQVDPVVARSLMLIKKFALAKKEIDEDPTRSPAQKVVDMENIVIDKIKIDDLYLDFTLPGYPEIELIPNGSQTRLTIDNVEEYLERVIDMTLGSGVRRQVDAFRQGFSQVFPYSALSAFTPDELCSLFGRVEEDWSLETLMDSVKADHGYNMDSKTVKNLLQVMSEMTPQQRRDFLQFTTGSPKLPIGGFKKLTPMFTVVCKASEPPYTSDDYLPSVMTCVNYLKLPDYSSIDILRQRLLTAIKEGQGAFHLS